MTHAILAGALAEVVRLHGVTLGNVQLMDWSSRQLRIAVNHGFGSEFLQVFHRVGMQHGSVCARALRERRPMLVDDVLADAAFEPYRAVAGRAGFRAVL